MPTPKIIESLRDLFPQAVIVGWKYEVEGDRPRALDLAREQLRRCRTNACVANGPGYGTGFGLVTLGEIRELADAEGLFEGLAELLRTRTALRP